MKTTWQTVAFVSQEVFIQIFLGITCVALNANLGPVSKARMLFRAASWANWLWESSSTVYPYIHTYPTYGGGFTDPHWTLEAVIFGLFSCELKSLYKQVPSVLKLDAFENQWCLNDVEKLLANKCLIAYTMETAYVALIRWREAVSSKSHAASKRTTDAHRQGW